MPKNGEGMSVVNHHERQFSIVERLIDFANNTIIGSGKWEVKSLVAVLYNCNLKMSGAQEQLEIKFRLIDGSDIGPRNFPVATSVATLKENIITQWPKEKQNGPRTVKDIKLISGGRILENNRTVGECKSPLCDIPGGVTTMHVVVQPPPTDKEKKLLSDPKQNRCGCVIL